MIPISTEFSIINSDLKDLDLIFHFFDSAIIYQQKNGYDFWPRFSEDLIITEISEKRHWKIMNGNETACVFSVLYSDPVIWGEEKNNDPALYLHRIAISPSCKGRQIMTVIRDWALSYAKQNGKKYVRMDTWGKNKNLRNYYISCGFEYIGQQYLKQTNEIPAHYGGSELSLFEIRL